VITAESAEAGRQVMAGDRPDILVADIGMPGEDGYSLIRSIRALPRDRGGSIPAAAVTALARAEDRRRALLAGFQTHVAKPVDVVELVAVVASLVGRTGR
jgi:CheY-like chemotaxis protein